VNYFQTSIVTAAWPLAAPLLEAAAAKHDRSGKNAKNGSFR
jgi:hypothetical protein